MKKFLTRAILVIVLLFVLYTGGTWLAFKFLSKSEGDRTGTLYKFSHKGVVVKTWEGSLNTGGINLDNAQPMGASWDFSVIDEEVVKQLKEVEGKRVKLTYEQKLFKLWWMGETDYFVTKVKVIE
jgi:hypothetical protein